MNIDKGSNCSSVFCDQKPSKYVMHKNTKYIVLALSLTLSTVFGCSCFQRKTSKMHCTLPAQEQLALSNYTVKHLVGKKRIISLRSQLRPNYI